MSTPPRRRRRLRRLWPQRRRRRSGGGGRWRADACFFAAWVPSATRDLYTLTPRLRDLAPGQATTGTQVFGHAVEYRVVLKPQPRSSICRAAVQYQVNVRTTALSAVHCHSCVVIYTCQPVAARSFVIRWSGCVRLRVGSLEQDRLPYGLYGSREVSTTRIRATELCHIRQELVRTCQTRHDSVQTRREPFANPSRIRARKRKTCANPLMRRAICPNLSRMRRELSRIYRYVQYRTAVIRKT